MLLPREKIDITVFTRNGAKWVRGCLTIKGNKHTGVSTFDKPVRVTKNHTVIHEIPPVSSLAEGLAVTRDGLNRTFGATHYTIAAKNDMPLDLFMASLKSLADLAKRL